MATLLDSNDIKLVHYNGGLALIGLPIRQFTPASIAEPHITLVTAAEYKAIHRPAIDGISIPLDRVYTFPTRQSTRSSNAVQWLVVVWNHANVWRASQKLATKAFHITLTSDDDHVVDKSLDAMMRNMGEDAFTNSCIGLGEEGIDHIILGLSSTVRHVVSVLFIVLADE
jgi:hypothetical protein